MIRLGLIVLLLALKIGETGAGTGAVDEGANVFMWGVATSAYQIEVVKVLQKV
jgi:hypothetical protein